MKFRAKIEAVAALQVAVHSLMCWIWADYAGIGSWHARAWASLLVVLLVMRLVSMTKDNEKAVGK